MPQGSVLGPLLFLLYSADVPLIASDHGLGIHCYADDGQLYLSDKAGNSANIVASVSNCINEINHWMSSNRLKLNSEKTQFIWIGTWQQLSKVETSVINLGPAVIPLKTAVTNLGVILDSHLSMKPHIQHVCRVSFYQLRQLRTIRKSLTLEACKTLIYAFVANRLDYCNSILFGINESEINLLQSVLRSAARLVMGKRKYDSISDDMRDVLHWLPIHQRIEFKICTFVYKCLHNIAPLYLREMLTPATGVDALRRNRSAGLNVLVAPRVNSVRFGGRSFAASGPKTWNSLPPNLRDPAINFVTFKKKLKTFLFSQAYKC